jgi:hypothetical protein
MNNTKKSYSHWFSKSACLITGMFAVLALIGCSSKPTVPAPPIPKGHAMIHVEFKKLSDDEFNNLTDFVRKLGKSHSALIKGSTTERDVGDYNAAIGFWNDGVIDQVYAPDHPIPSPKVEASMKAELETYLRGKGIAVGGVTLELRYGT